MRLQRLLFLSAIILGITCVGNAQSKDFSFSDSDARDKVEQEKSLSEGHRLIEELMATPCSDKLKNRKTAIIIAEHNSDGSYETNQSNYGLHFTEINKRLNAIGLRTYTPEEIKAQIRAAEVKALMENDPDAQMSAGSRLGASFILRGLIDSRTTFNSVVQVNEVHVTMSFTLLSSGGKTVASVSEEAEAWSGSDTVGAALALVKEKADAVIASLYKQYCENTK